MATLNFAQGLQMCAEAVRKLNVAVRDDSRPDIHGPLQILQPHFTVYGFDTMHGNPPMHPGNRGNGKLEIRGDDLTVNLQGVDNYIHSARSVGRKANFRWLRIDK